MLLPTLGIVFNWRNQKNKSGLYSVHLRIKIGDDARYYKIDTPQKIRIDEWSGKENNWVKQTHPFAFEINNKILEKKNIVHDLIKRCYNFNKPVSFETIFQHLRRKGDRQSFFDYMDQYIKNPPEKLELNTLKKYRTCLTHLKSFKKQMHFSDIEPGFVKDFYRYMQTELELGGAACKKYMDAFKKVIKQARKEHYLDPTQMEFLFDDVKIKVGRSKRTFLEPNEIQSWKKAKIPEDQGYLSKDRDLFLFQIYTGYYYKDLQRLSKEQLVADEEYGLFILGDRDKNGNATIIPLFKFPYASNILRKYRSSDNDALVFDSKYLIEEPAYNRNLKQIAKLAGIKKSVSNKVARHTNAQLWIRYGAKRPVVSKMLGHTKEETTNTYFSINIPEIIEGTKKVDFKRLGI
jgi:site-specific recombinase XerD